MCLFVLYQHYMLLIYFAASLVLYCLSIVSPLIEKVVLEIYMPFTHFICGLAMLVQTV